MKSDSDLLPEIPVGSKVKIVGYGPNEQFGQPEKYPQYKGMAQVAMDVENEVVWNNLVLVDDGPYYRGQLKPYAHDAMFWDEVKVEVLHLKN